MKRSRQITSAAAAGILALSAAASYDIFPETEKTVYAGQLLGQTDFESGSGLPWQVCESETGEMEYEIKDGKFTIKIVNPGGKSNGGQDRWDCQFRYRGLKITAGHTYEVSYEITSDKDGQYYTKIGNMAGDVELWHSNTGDSDFNSTWNMIPISAGETKKVKMTFVPSKSLDSAEWAFHLGGDGSYTSGGCFKAGTSLTFDNMSLIDVTSDENDYKSDGSSSASGEILANQVGYFPGAEKRATIVTSSSDPVDFEIVDSDGKSVYKGKSTAFGHDDDSDKDVQIIDFSDFTDEGEGYRIKSGNSQSRAFSIKKDLYSGLLYDSLNYFYQNRSGIQIESKYISSGDKDKLARKAGHNPDLADSGSYSLDVTGGWYDAGDHGKYVVNGGISLWTMQNQYERAVSLDTGSKNLYDDGKMNIPESGNNAPDILDEARYELEWMMKMIVPDGNQYAGMLHHKVHDEKWTGLALAPSDDTMKRVLKAPSTAATLNFAACAAQAARLWKGTDDDFSEKCLESAEKAYEAAVKNPSLMAPLEDGEGGGAYGDDCVDDEFYWAQCELYLTTGDKKYYEELKKSDSFLKINTSLKGGESKSTFGSFDWENVAALGNMSIAYVKKGFSDDEIKTLSENIAAAADVYVETEASQGFGIPIRSSVTYVNGSEINGYPWGSNSFVVNTAMIMAYAYDLTGDIKYYNGAVGAMDYILGRNPMDISYVTGYGENTTKNPHHRFWANQTDPSFPEAPAGVLSGGPNSGLQDPWVQGLGWSAGTLAPQLCYADHIEAWSTNECTINWNAPLAWLSGFFTEEITDNSPVKQAETEQVKTEKKEKNKEKNKETTESEKAKQDRAKYKDSLDTIKNILTIIGAAVVGILAVIGLGTVLKFIFRKK